MYLKDHQNDRQIYPLTVTPWLLRGLIALNQGNGEKALQFCKKALDIDPSHIDTFTLAVKIYIQNNDCKTALECCDKALKINPQHAETWAIKAEAHMLLADYKKAIECCGNALKINPEEQTALLVMSTVEDLQKGKYNSPFAAAYNVGFFKQLSSSQMQSFLGTGDNKEKEPESKTCILM